MSPHVHDVLLGALIFWSSFVLVGLAYLHWAKPRLDAWRWRRNCKRAEHFFRGL